IEHPQPVFIVGMLRSGTTLVEQILSSHPEVAGAGELTFWTRELAQWLTATSAPAVSQMQLVHSDLGRARSAYLQLLAQHSQGKARVVDKLPTNFLSLGLIH